MDELIHPQLLDLILKERNLFVKRGYDYNKDESSHQEEAMDMEVFQMKRNLLAPHLGLKKLMHRETTNHQQKQRAGPTPLLFPVKLKRTKETEVVNYIIHSIVEDRHPKNRGLNREALEPGNPEGRSTGDHPGARTGDHSEAGNSLNRESTREPISGRQVYPGVDTGDWALDPGRKTRDALHPGADGPSVGQSG
ncbi:hypothetical protein L6452_17342 [Arctium lappa]|uniref:Uncharacterized protein n=1 Tax=Arctium lappa TaxID=4217 RepID=A0ACB9C303_ARCLA|nr:hypothetical protein L6452_17342 [Arctium lappa]